MRRVRKVGIIGCGAIGTSIATFIDSNLRGKLKLVGICDKDKKRLSAVKKLLHQKPRVFSLARIVEHSDLIIEAATIDVAKKVILAGIKNNKDLIVLSVGVFVFYPHIISMVRKYEGNLYIPSGAICGIDGLQSLRFITIKKLILTTSKPPQSLKGGAFLDSGKVNIERLQKPKVLFKGGIKKAIQHFPRNINVAATIFLASQFQNIEVVIRVDPTLRRNTHSIEAISDEACMKIEVENIPSQLNPKTSYLAILSTQALLEKITSNIKIGT